MKDTIITAKAKRRELKIFAVCLILAILINVYSIISYGTSWSELYTMAGMVATLGIFLYILQWIIRLLTRGIAVILRQMTE